MSFFTKNIADDYIQVQRGEIIYPTKEEINKRFSEYLNSTEFSKYDNIRDPIIKVSKDGSLAWCIVQMKIEGEQKLKNDSIYQLNFTCAWITLYENVDDTWISLGTVDNFKFD